MSHRTSYTNKALPVALRGWPKLVKVRYEVNADRDWEFWCLAWSPDGRQLAVGERLGVRPSVRGRVRVLSMESGLWTDLSKALINMREPQVIQWSPDGQRLAVGDSVGMLAVVHVASVHLEWQEISPDDRTPSPRRPYPRPGPTKTDLTPDEFRRSYSSIFGLAWSPSGDFLSVVGAGRGVLIRSANSGAVVEVLQNDEPEVAAVSWFSSNHLAIGGAFHPNKRHRGAISIVRLGEKQPSEILTGHSHIVTRILWNAQKNRLWSVSLDKTLRLWDVLGERQLGQLEGLKSDIRAISLAGDYPVLAAQTHFGETLLIHADTLEKLAELPTRGESMFDTASFRPSESLLALVDRGRLLFLEIDVPALLHSRSNLNGTRYANAKMVLVGDTGVGKSGMALRLRGKPWRETDSTHGRKVHLLKSVEDKTDPHGPIRRDVLLWDLAGQSDYRLTHQLHLDMATVALVLFDSRDPKQPLAAPEYWSHALSLARMQDPVVKLLVAAREDRTGVGLPDRVVEDFCKRHGFKKWFRTSARRNIGVKELRQFALEQIDWSKLPVITSTGWLEAVRAQVEKCRKAKKSGMIQSVGKLFDAFNKRRKKNALWMSLWDALKGLTMQMWFAS